MKQPTISEITKQIQRYINGELSRENVSDWAYTYIKNDKLIEEFDSKAWDYLMTVYGMDLLVSPNVYLHSLNEIKDWIKECDVEN
ncbi:MAG: DNA-binding protein [Firmicutes bacterium]|nr:DNA-binding protein [Bacillota bacterium]